MRKNKGTKFKKMIVRHTTKGIKGVRFRKKKKVIKLFYFDFSYDYRSKIDVEDLSSTFEV